MNHRDWLSLAWHAIRGHDLMSMTDSQGKNVRYFCGCERRWPKKRKNVSGII